MRLRILTRPARTIEGVCLEQFQVGEVYELGTLVASVFLAEGCAEPITDDDAVAVRPAPRPKPLVLVVDDDHAMRDLATNVLTARGYHVMVAAHGRDAIDRMRHRCPSVIVLDLDMPVMDGWQFRAEQRYFTDPARAAVPVLLMTGRDDAATHADTLDAVGIVKKPFDPDDLLEAVAAAITS